MKKFKKFFNRAGEVTSRFFGNVKTRAMLAGCAVLGLASAARAEGEAVDYSLVTKGTNGQLVFTPENMANPIADGLISGYKSWAIIFLIIVVASLIFWIFRKK